MYQYVAVAFLPATHPCFALLCVAKSEKEFADRQPEILQSPDTVTSLAHAGPEQKVLPHGRTPRLLPELHTQVSRLYNCLGPPLVGSLASPHQQH